MVFGRLYRVFLDIFCQSEDVVDFCILQARLEPLTLKRQIAFSDDSHFQVLETKQLT